MTALARNPPSFALDAKARSRDHDTVTRLLSLRPDRDWCSLVTPAGQLVFEAQGNGARRQCLQFAQSLGVLTLMR